MGKQNSYMTLIGVTFDHASHAPQLMSCNYYVHVCVTVCVSVRARVYVCVCALMYEILLCACVRVCKGVRMCVCTYV